MTPILRNLKPLLDSVTILTWCPDRYADKTLINKVQFCFRKNSVILWAHRKHSKVFVILQMSRKHVISSKSFEELKDDGGLGKRWKRRGDQRWGFCLEGCICDQVATRIRECEVNVYSWVDDLKREIRMKLKNKNESKTKEGGTNCCRDTVA